jgi:hypothetical protein
MPAEPSAAGYGCREASEVIASVVRRRGGRASGDGRYSIGRVRVVLSWSAEPASRIFRARTKNVGRCARQA